jgi:hypothetical protein
VELGWMARKKRKAKFTAAKAVKSAARNVIGSPKPTQREVPKTKKRVEKHKRKLSDLLSPDGY